MWYKDVTDSKLIFWSKNNLQLSTMQYSLLRYHMNVMKHTNQSCYHHHDYQTFKKTAGIFKHSIMLL